MKLAKTLVHGAVLACALVALAGLSAAAEDKKGDKDKSAPSGVWQLNEGHMRIEFADKGVMKISPHGKDELILILCKYTAEKDGAVKVKVTELTGEAKDKVKDVLPVGYEFSFKWNAKDDTAMLDGMKGDNVEHLKSHLEGKYGKK